MLSILDCTLLSVKILQQIGKGRLKEQRRLSEVTALSSFALRKFWKVQGTFHWSCSLLASKWLLEVKSQAHLFSNLLLLVLMRELVHCLTEKGEINLVSNHRIAKTTAKHAAKWHSTKTAVHGWETKRKSRWFLPRLDEIAFWLYLLLSLNGSL